MAGIRGALGNGESLPTGISLAITLALCQNFSARVAQYSQGFSKWRRVSEEDAASLEHVSAFLDCKLPPAESKCLPISHDHNYN